MASGARVYSAVCVNVGCGQTPTSGWRNFDNSPSVRLARWPLVAMVLDRLRLLNREQREYIRYLRSMRIEYADASRRIPIADGSADLVYSSHMLEHLDRTDASAFLREVYRILRPGGQVRLVVPDLTSYVGRYLESRDADAFMESTLLCELRPRGLGQKLRALLVGRRHHQWLYDGASLCRLLQDHGFAEPRVLPAGVTLIPDPGHLNLSERAGDSVYVEAYRP